MRPIFFLLQRIQTNFSPNLGTILNWNKGINLGYSFTEKSDALILFLEYTFGNNFLWVHVTLGDFTLEKEKA